MDKLKKLHTLNLSGNIIERIERLDKLTRLRELNLSYNRIGKLEGLETLSSLQHLNVTGNQIETVPPWLPKKLKMLRSFRVAKNEIQSVINCLAFMNEFNMKELEIFFVLTASRAEQAAASSRLDSAHNR